MRDQGGGARAHSSQQAGALPVPSAPNCFPCGRPPSPRSRGACPDLLLDLGSIGRALKLLSGDRHAAILTRPRPGAASLVRLKTPTLAASRLDRLRPFSTPGFRVGRRRIQHPLPCPRSGATSRSKGAHAWSDRRRFIADTPAVGWPSAAVKLRQLIHPELGNRDGHRMTSLPRPRRSRRDRGDVATG